MILYHGRKIEGARAIKTGAMDLLRDESRLEPEIPERIYFPSSTEEAAAAVRECKADGLSVTVSGGRTGITGGAVPASEALPSAVISLQNIRHLEKPRQDPASGDWTIHAGAGVTLSALQQDLTHAAGDQKLFFPVDPTETTATLGGMTASNASGARTLGYGPMRRWVEAVTVVTAEGGIVEVKRGECRAHNGNLSLPPPLSGSVPIQAVTIPDTKHAAGYYLTEESDLTDLFIGSEGTLGIITELTLRLTPVPDRMLYLTIFMHRDDPGALVNLLTSAGSFSPDAVEYMDSRSVSLLRRCRRELGEASHVPLLPSSCRGIIFTEIPISGEDSFDETSRELTDIMTRCGIPPEMSWAGFHPRDLREMKNMRHALPEKINSIICERKKRIPGLTKIGTDMAVPRPELPGMLDFYTSELKRTGLRYCIFGHIGNGHLHINILPRNGRDLIKARELYDRFAREAVRRKGSVCGEHGIGRIKRKLMTIQYTSGEIDAMRRVKEVFDPHGRLNPGVLFPDEASPEQENS